MDGKKEAEDLSDEWERGAHEGDWEGTAKEAGGEVKEHIVTASRAEGIWGRRLLDVGVGSEGYKTDTQVLRRN